MAGDRVPPWVTGNVRAEGKVAYDRYSDEVAVPGRNGSYKAFEHSTSRQ